MQAVDKVLLLFGQAFNIDGDAATGVGDLAFLVVLPGKANCKRTETQSLNESFDIDF